MQVTNKKMIERIVLTNRVAVSNIIRNISIKKSNSFYE